jgi:cytochrome b561
MPEAVVAQPRRLSRSARRAAIGLFVLLVAVPLAGVAVISNFKFRPAAGFLEIEMQASGGTAAQLFWTSSWAFTH